MKTGAYKRRPRGQRLGTEFMWAARRGDCEWLYRALAEHDGVLPVGGLVPGKARKAALANRHLDFARLVEATWPEVIEGMEPTPFPAFLEDGPESSDPDFVPEDDSPEVRADWEMAERKRAAAREEARRRGRWIGRTD